MKDRATRLGHVCALRLAITTVPLSPSTFPYGFLDRSRNKVRIKPTHDLIRVSRTYWGDPNHRRGPIDDVLALLWVLPTKWMSTPFDLYQES